MRAFLVRATVALALLGTTVAADAQDAAPIPPLTARVVDAAALMTADQRAALEAVLADYETRKGTQIAVLTVPNTAPEAIEQYGIRVAEAWKIGRKQIADGVILIVAKDNPRDLRRLRIEVGKGLEGTVTDQRARRIIDEDIAPHFRQNDWYGGLVAGVNRVESLLEGESLPAPSPTTGASSGATTGGLGVGGLVLLIVIASFLFGGSRRRGFGYVSGRRGLNGSIGPMVLGGILGSLGSPGNRGGGGGFGGGGGGGGFTGGGGDFGGGGASGDW